MSVSSSTSEELRRASHQGVVRVRTAAAKRSSSRAARAGSGTEPKVASSAGTQTGHSRTSSRHPQKPPSTRPRRKPSLTSPTDRAPGSEPTAFPTSVEPLRPVPEM